jgi:hypothetical protein
VTSVTIRCHLGSPAMITAKLGDHFQSVPLMLEPA